MMQPLMYQFTNVTCWYASMINGIIFFRQRCTDVPYENLVSPMEDRLLRSLTAQYTEFSDDAWKSDEECEYYDSVMECLGRIAGFEVRTCRGGDVRNEIRGLKLNHEVAVCNMSKGAHSILLHGRDQSDQNWVKCFDPCWDHVNPEENSESYSTKPDDSPTNLMVTEEHLLRYGDHKFRMGRTDRVLTILRAC